MGQGCLTCMFWLKMVEFIGAQCVCVYFRSLFLVTHICAPELLFVDDNMAYTSLFFSVLLDIHSFYITLGMVPAFLPNSEVLADKLLPNK